MDSDQPNNADSSSPKPGFDAAIVAREHDHLNRWPFAQEIYGIATTGPRDWSVRIGIYGEWGTGKTSVLNFIKLMAARDSHAIVSFNPWRFTSTDELWKDFVRVIFERIEEVIGERQQGATAQSAKRMVSEVIGTIPAIIRLWRQDAGKVADSGLSYLKRFLSFGPNDLVELRENLGDRRIIVLIDDLDRTDPKLVPEMLFALKEIMDVPGMAFACAFDPKVVGEVLGQFHPGFGDGLKFLEKIIDYPRWLRGPTARQLAQLAISDATQYCPYVPLEALEEAVSLLPTNPRAIRQFVRLLALLKPQIERHAEHELHWPILLAANVAKVRFPKVAPEILANDRFWHSIYQASVMGKEGQKDERKEIVDKEVAKLATVRGLDESIASDLSLCIWAIAQKLRVWFGISHEHLMYQFHLAEEPCAVTWKEFEEFLASAGNEMSKDVVEEWISNRALQTGHSKDQVFEEVFLAATQERQATLGRAADATGEASMRSQVERADILLKLLRILLIELGRIETPLPRLSADNMGKLLESFAQYSSWNTNDVYRRARQAEQDILVEVASAWGPDILPLVSTVGLQHWEGKHDLQGAEWQAIIRRLREMIKPKFASWIIVKIRDSPTFVQTYFHGEKQGYRIREFILNKDEALWKDRREEMLAVLKSASSSEVVRGNVYQVAEWINYLLREDNRDGKQTACDLLSDKQISLSLWNALIAEPLNPRAIGSLQRVVSLLKKSGFILEEPEWWKRAIASFESRKIDQGPGDTER